MLDFCYAATSQTNRHDRVIIELYTSSSSPQNSLENVWGRCRLGGGAQAVASSFTRNHGKIRRHVMNL